MSYKLPCQKKPVHKRNGASNSQKQIHVASSSGRPANVGLNGRCARAAPIILSDKPEHYIETRTGKRIPVYRGRDRVTAQPRKSYAQGKDK